MLQSQRKSHEEWIRDNSPFTFRPAALDPTLRENVNAANRRYLDSYTPFGIAGQEIPRAESSVVLAELHAAAGPSLILLTGVGRQRQVRRCARSHDRLEGTVRSLTSLSGSIVTFPAGQETEVGSVVLDRDESLVSALTNLARTALPS